MFLWMPPSVCVEYYSYEGLKNTFYELQTRLTLLTGEDPLKDKHVSFIGPQVSPQKITTQLHDGINNLSHEHTVVVLLISLQ